MYMRNWGEGKIGLEALSRFLKHEKLENVPLLTEPPVMGLSELKDELEKLREIAK